MGARNYFGTDGVRGTVGASILTVDFAMKLGRAAGKVLAPGGGKAVIGRDTRESGPMFEEALQKGLTSAGVDVLMLGVVPTPGIAYVGKELGCNFSVVVSASHNAYTDNGIKFFDANGEKLSDDVEEKIEALLDEKGESGSGAVLSAEEKLNDYIAFCVKSAGAVSLEGMNIVVDAAHGAGYTAPPSGLSPLGAEVIPLSVTPNGTNINDNCGATAPHAMQNAVVTNAADAGIALDGDADRLIMADHEGSLINGDALLYILARAYKKNGMLRGPVVGTVLSNMGLEEALKKEGIEFLRAQVGDRYVMELLKKDGGVLGAEPSGHILMLDKTTTGDGIVAAVAVLSAMRESRLSLKELAAGMRFYPQVSENVKVAKRFEPLERPAIAEKIHQIQNQGAIVIVRASGTESTIRATVQAKDENLAHSSVLSLKEVIENESKKE